ncbi:MAG TPA: hypothetical protein VFZ59_13015 [Verrucomicrobiae bacterium]|nr:hypothetical protein [Verrucomicrobiae bacterium]
MCLWWDEADGRAAGRRIWPFLPGTAGKIYTQLGLLGEPNKFDTSGWGGLPAGHAIGEPAPLFPRKDA